MKYQTGFSLVEVMIAVIVLGFGLLAATKMQLNMSLATQLSRQREEATLMASNVMEKARAAGCVASAKTQLAAAAQASTQYSMQVECSASTMRVTVEWKDAQTMSGDSDNKVMLVSQL